MERSDSARLLTSWREIATAYLLKASFFLNCLWVAVKVSIQNNTTLITEMPPDTQVLQQKSSADESSGKPGEGKGLALLGSIPPTGLVLLAVVSVQVGAGLATQLFPTLGPEGTVAIRILFAAFLMVLIVRGRVLTFHKTFAQNWGLLLAFGLCISVMNLFFYKAIALIPLGAAVAVEFIGPLGVAVLTSRRVSHFAWVALAALGIILLSPLAGADLDTWGILFALTAGLAWALFIILSRRVSSLISGNDGLVIGMAVAAISMIPFAAPVITDLVSSPLILLLAFAVALLSTTIPFTLEFEALKKIPARTYGILVSVEPAVAALVGALLLGERIGIQGMIAVACVVIAAIGITISDGRNSS
jgi:inner membrane transporter RhtA